MPHETPSALVIGGGPAGLMAAETMAKAGLQVSVYDQMPSPGRKFLMAGRGGLNLTHSEDLPAFLQRYDAPDWMEPLVSAFPPQALRQWAEELGEPTFIGSSGRVFPKSFKASPLLRAWLRRLDGLGVQFFPRHRFIGLKPGGIVRLTDPAGLEIERAASATVLAMGGASWKRLGSDGAWADILRQQGVAVTPLCPANCGFELDWSYHFRSRYAGAPLKTIRLTHGTASLRGAANITARGLEGGIVYGLAAAIREEILAKGSASVALDLRPDVPLADLAQRLSRPRGKDTMSNFLRKAGGLDPVAVGLVQEMAHAGHAPLPQEPLALAQLIKALPLRLNGVAGMDQAISTAGGVARGECDDGLMLTRWPGVFVAGEMLDWEAPTGGYLLQACFATGFVAGRAASRIANLQVRL